MLTSRLGTGKSKSFFYGVAKSSMQLMPYEIVRFYFSDSCVESPSTTPSPVCHTPAMSPRWPIHSAEYHSPGYHAPQQPANSHRQAQWQQELQRASSTSLRRYCRWKYFKKFSSQNVLAIPLLCVTSHDYKYWKKITKNIVMICQVLRNYPLRSVLWTSLPTLFAPWITSNTTFVVFSLWRF